MPREEAGPTVGRRVEITPSATKGATGQAPTARGGDRTPPGLEARRGRRVRWGRGGVRRRVGDGGVGDAGRVGQSGFFSFSGRWGGDQGALPDSDLRCSRGQDMAIVKARRRCHRPSGCT